MSCHDCGLVWYFNPAPAVIALIRNCEGKYLFTRRKFDPAAGMLDLPGGFVDSGETSEAALLREVLEETGLTIARYSFLFTLTNEYIYKDLLYHTLDSVYFCETDDCSMLKPSDDVTEILFLSPDQVNEGELGLRSVRQLVSYLKTLPLPT